MLIKIMIVIGLTGMNGCGKSIVSEYLKKKGFERFIFSDFLKMEAKKRGIMTEDKNELSKFGKNIREETHQGILAELIVKYIKENDIEKAVIDGFRSKEEVDIFRKSVEKFILIKVDVKDEIRMKRLMKRDPFVSKEKIRERDMRDLKELGLEKVLGMADTSVDNSGTKENLYKQIDKIISC